MLEKVFGNYFDVKNVCKGKIKIFKKKMFFFDKKQVQILTKTQVYTWVLVRI